MTAMTFNSIRLTTSTASFASRAWTGADEEPSAAVDLQQAPATTPSPLHGASSSQSLLDAVMYRFGSLSGAGAQAASMSSRATSPADMKTSQKGVDLIKSFEGLRTTAYQDAVGVWTIGYGHTGPDVKPGMKITKAKAESLLRQDLGKFENAVQRNVKVPLTQGQFDALVSFTYNLGEGNLKNSTLLKKLNQGDYAGAQAEFGKWTYAGGKELPGLVRRRKEEAAMFGSEGPSGGFKPPPPDGTVHDVKVRAGETMTSIAEREGVSLSALIKANPQIKDPDRIFPDQAIHVPGVRASEPPSSGSPSKAVA